MSTLLRAAFIFFLTISVSSCGFFDSGVVWRGGPYALMWIDLPDDVGLSYDADNGAWLGRIDPHVFAVGWDGHYLVAQQHPKGDKRVTNYFIIDSTKDSMKAEVKAVVIGPLTESEFGKKSVELNLPTFSKVLESLR